MRHSLHFGITVSMFSFWFSFSFSFSSFGSFIQVICPFLFSHVCLLISVYSYVCTMFSWFSVIFHCIIFILFSECYCCSFAIFHSQHSVIICCYITILAIQFHDIPHISLAALSLHTHLNELMIIRISHECWCQIPMLN